MHRPPTLALLLLLALPAAPQSRLPYSEHTLPAGFHLGSYGSQLGARFGSDGTLDTGAGVLQLFDARTGEPLPVIDLDFGKGPALWLGYSSELQGAEVETVWLALPQTASGDTRLVGHVQVKLVNPGAEPLDVALGARLYPGDGGGERRPVVALPFDPGTTWAPKETVVTRDGLAVLSWVGDAPKVDLPAVTGPGDPAAWLVWDLSLPPGEARYVELKVAGPPAGRAVADGSDGPVVAVHEEEWRRGFRRSTFARQEESLRWQWQFHGSFGDFDSASRPFWNCMVGGVHFLRSLGDAHFEVTALSDRPYGHPATDAAVEAEIVGIFLEWGLDGITVPYQDQLIAQLNERTQDLTPERRLAYVHGLARGVRLLQSGAHDFILANAILAFVDQPLAVAPWHDPAEVRRDLLAVLDKAGLGDASALPELLWAEVAPDSLEALMQAARRALSEGRQKDAWDLCTRIMARATPSGLGGMTLGGELDGLFSIGMLTLQRRILIDDHGKDLVIFPGLAYGLFQKGRELTMPELPTRFGHLRAQAFHTSAKEFGGWIVFRPAFYPERMLMQLPEGVEGVPGRFKIEGGTVELVDGGRRLQLEHDPAWPRGLRFTARVR